MYSGHTWHATCPPSFGCCKRSLLQPLLVRRRCNKSHEQAASGSDVNNTHVWYVQVTDQYNERWRSDWFTSDFWHILNFVFLCVIAFLWRPSANSTRFAYSALEGMQSILWTHISQGIKCLSAFTNLKQGLGYPLTPYVLCFLHTVALCHNRC